jgi:hypothetical protein
MQRMKNIIERLILILMRGLTLIVPPRLIQSILGVFAYTPLRGIVYNIWSRILIYSGRRVQKSKWSKTFWDRSSFPSGRRIPSYGLAYVQDCMALGDLKLQDDLDALKKAVYFKNTMNNVHYRHRLNLLNTIFEIESEGTLGENQHNIYGSKLSARYFRQRMERAHAMRNEKRVDLYVRSYCSAVKYNPRLVRRVCKDILSVNGLDKTAVELLDVCLEKLFFNQNSRLNLTQEKKESSSKRALGLDDFLDFLRNAWDQDTDTLYDELECQYQKASHLLELSEFEIVRGLVEAYPHYEKFKSLSAKELYFQKDLSGSEAALRKIINGGFNSKARSERLGELAEILEEQKKYDAALALYRAAYNNSEDEGLNISRNASWRYVHVLLSGGHWDEAVAVMRDAQKYMWRFFFGFGRMSPQRLLKMDYRLPQEGGIILGCWGIGDELFRLGIWKQLANKKAKWAITCEPRLESIIKRSFPQMDVIVNTRTNGPYAVSELSYWESREGVPVKTDLARISLPTINAIKKYNNVILSETLLYEFVKRRGHIKNPSTDPTLITDPQHLENAKNWLETLPDGLNVAISWRSGKRSATRDKSYTNLIDWGDVFAVRGVNFINIQYSDTEEEKDEVREKYDANLFEMPGVNRKNDLEALIALCKACDIVIAPCTAVREMSGAVGANTWSLTTTPYLPDLWRIADDGKTDIFFPTMKHFTAKEFGSKKDVLKAIAEGIQKYQVNDHAAR